MLTAFSLKRFLLLLIYSPSSLSGRLESVHLPGSSLSAVAFRVGFRPVLHIAPAQYQTSLRPHIEKQVGHTEAGEETMPLPKHLIIGHRDKRFIYGACSFRPDTFAEVGDP